MRTAGVTGTLVGCAVGAGALALMGLGPLPIAGLVGLAAATGIGVPALLERRRGR